MTATFYAPTDRNQPLSACLREDLSTLSKDPEAGISIVEFRMGHGAHHHTQKSAIEPFGEQLDESAIEDQNEIIVIGADQVINTNDHIAHKIRTIAADKAKDLRIILDDPSLLEDKNFLERYREIHCRLFLVDTPAYFLRHALLRDTVCQIAREVYAGASEAVHQQFADTLSAITLSSTYPPGEALRPVENLVAAPPKQRELAEVYRHEETGLFFPPVPKQTWTEYAKSLPAPGRGRKRNPSGFILSAYQDYIKVGLLYYPHLKKSDVALYNAVWSFVGRSGGAADMEAFYRALDVLTPSDLEHPGERYAHRAAALMAINVNLTGRRAVRGYIKTRRTRIDAKPVAGPSAG